MFLAKCVHDPYAFVARVKFLGTLYRQVEVVEPLGLVVKHGVDVSLSIDDVLVDSVEVGMFAVGKDDLHGVERELPFFKWCFGEDFFLCIFDVSVCEGGEVSGVIEEGFDGC